MRNKAGTWTFNVKIQTKVKMLRNFTREGNKINNVKSLKLELGENGLESVVWSRNVVVRATEACPS